MTQTASRYAHIDAMRAMAVMFVVLAHAGMSGFIPGGGGVTIFFSISGFIITYLMLRERDATGGFGIRSFYVRRVVKIGPPLLICVIIPTLVLAIFKPIDWPSLFGIVFFYFNWFSEGGGLAPIYGTSVVWSLSIEEQFYVVFAIVWALSIKSGLRLRWLAIAAAGAATASLATRLIIAAEPGNHLLRIYYGSDTRLDGLAMGVLTAIAFHQSLRGTGRIHSLVALCQRDVALIAAIGIFLASLAIRDQWFRDTLQYSFRGVATCIAILYGFGTKPTFLRTAFNKITRIRIIQFIGLASYSIYLIHLTAMETTNPITAHWPVALKVPVLILVGTCSGIAIYLAVEKPVQHLREKWSSGEKGRQPTTDATTADGVGDHRSDAARQ